MERNQRNPSVADVKHNVQLFIWTLNADEEGQPAPDIEEFNMKTVQVVGELAGASVEIVGEIVPGEPELLTDYDSMPLAFLTRGIKSSDDRVSNIRPRVIGGSTATEVKVGILICR